MELKDFVSETLTQILQGVRESQKRQEEHGGEINLSVWSRSSSEGAEGAIQHKGFLVSKSRKAIDYVNFDVAITLTRGKGAKAGIGVFVGAVGLGSQGQTSSSEGSINRIQFKVPISFPQET